MHFAMIAVPRNQIDRLQAALRQQRWQTQRRPGCEVSISRLLRRSKCCATIRVKTRPNTGEVAEWSKAAVC